jgi:hypothetical protein
MRKILFLAVVAALTSSSAQAQTPPRYLVSDANAPARVTHCVLTRPTTPPTVYESPAELVGSMKRCKIDLIGLSIPMIGTVTVAYKDAAVPEVGPSASYTFLDPIPSATGLRQAAN